MNATISKGEAGREAAQKDATEEVFSVLIPTWNNLEQLQLCVRSLRENSDFRHQIIVHVNDGDDGTLAWVRREGLDHTHTERNVGVCIAMNMMRSKVRTSYICFFNDDMYALPHWDGALMSEIRRLKDNRFCLSSVAIQRRPHTQSPSITADYGDDTATFREQALLKEYMSLPMSDRIGAIAPPNVVHRDVWDLVGGYSVELSPGMHSDPDFAAKLLLVGVRHMRMVAASRCYHFQYKSTGRVERNDGVMQFLLKWGMTARTFRRMMRNGEPVAAAIDEETSPVVRPSKALLRRSRVKAVWWTLTRRLGPLWPFLGEGSRTAH